MTDLRVLLDTHTLLWWAADTKTLSRKVKRLIEDDRTSVYVSAASAWEIATKVRFGKLKWDSPESVESYCIGPGVRSATGDVRGWGAGWVMAAGARRSIRSHARRSGRQRRDADRDQRPENPNLRGENSLVSGRANQLTRRPGSAGRTCSISRVCSTEKR